MPLATAISIWSNTRHARHSILFTDWMDNCRKTCPSQCKTSTQLSANGVAAAKRLKKQVKGNQTNC